MLTIYLIGLVAVGSWIMFEHRLTVSESSIYDAHAKIFAIGACLMCGLLWPVFILALFGCQLSGRQMRLTFSQADGIDIKFIRR